MENIIQIIKNNVIAIVCFLSIFVFAVLLQLFGIIESFQQFVVVLASAAATYIIVQITMNNQNKQQSELQTKLIEQQNKLQKELLENQSKEDNKAKRDLELYNAKLKVYSDYVSEMYNALGDNHVTKEELIDLRTKLFGSIAFYAGENVLEDILKKLNDIFFEKENGISPEVIDLKMSLFFSGITKILQNDTEVNNNIKEMSINNNDNPKEKEKDIVQMLWTKLQDIIKKIEEQEKKEKEDREKERQKEEQYKKEIAKDKQINESPNITIKDDEINDEENGLIINQQSDNREECFHETKQDDTDGDKSLYLKEQTWHFNAWGDPQFKQFEELNKEEYELSLVEYGEYWRTNLLKQVEKGDIIMLFRRGGYGYVGAFEAIGRRVFDFEKGEEEILYFDEEKPRPVENFDEDAEKYDIYKSREDGATLCSNLIVKCVAYVPGGVGNPGGVYRRTISRYDSHYAWLLKERFQKEGQWGE